MSKNKVSGFPRLVRPVPDPLGLYLRPGHNDHRPLLDLIAAGDFSCFGVVFDSDKLNSQSELKEQILKHRLDAILDPKTAQSATPGGYTEKLGSLPWGKERIHNYDDFQNYSSRRIISQLADFAIENEFTQIMAPTHFISDIGNPWLDIDIRCTGYLRNYLDKNGYSSIPIIYPLLISYSILRNEQPRQYILELLKRTNISSLWLRVDGIGREGTGAKARGYIDASHDFHSLGIPVVADNIGGAFGLSLLSFGAVGGISHGVTLSERFSSSNWKKPITSNPFKQARRVYIPAIDSMLKVSEVEDLFQSSTRGRAYFGCTDTKCCPRGIKDMLQDPARHFLYQRMKEINELSQMPETIRPQRFLDRHLRPATDKALLATNAEWSHNEKMLLKMQKNRMRLDKLRIALGDYAENHSPQSFAKHPKTRVARGMT